MDDIDTQIMSVMRDTDSQCLSCYEVADLLKDRFGNDYPPKRIRNRLDSLYTYHYLERGKQVRGKGMPTNVYSLPTEGIA